jgi:SecD/SecF fusion protein
MQNKSAVWLFTVLLALATLYILSKSWVSSRFETQAEKYVVENLRDSLMAEYNGNEDKVADAIVRETKKYLRDSANVEIYPIMGYTYQQVKEQELNLGLDLQGGMSVTLEVSIPDLIIALSDYSQNSDFLAAIERAKALQLEDNADFVTLFKQAWNEQNNSLELWRIFLNLETKGRFNNKMTNDDVFDVLQEEADAAISNTENIIKKRIDQFGVAQPNVQKQSLTGRIIVELPGVDDEERIRTKLKSTANLEFWYTYRFNEVQPAIFAMDEAASKKQFPGVREALLEKSKADSTGTDSTTVDVNEPVDTAAIIDSLTTDDGLDLTQDGEGDGDNGLDDPDKVVDDSDRAKASPLISKFLPVNTGGSPILGYVAESDTDQVNTILKLAEVKAAQPTDLILLWAAKSEPLTLENQESGDKRVVNALALYMIRDDSERGKAPLDGSVITDARVSYDQAGNPEVSMSMSSDEGAPKWLEMTTEAFNNNKAAIAITMDNLVYSAPGVRNGPIAQGRSSISLGAGNVNDQLNEAEDLSQLLKAGSLPAPAKIVDEYTVGPSLGQKNIDAGLLSFLIALLVILAYMIFYYKGAGVVSNLALVANLFFLIGALASLGAALTLPGIAGIVLTIGMAVDANVLIYERIREEMRNGKGLSAAVTDGYNKAYSAIIDANITTLLTAIILFAFGSGPIRGFATTLIIGIFTSLFSAIVITRLVFFNRLEKKKGISFATNITKNWFTKVNIQFVERRKIFYVISGLVIVGGLASLFTKGLDFGVDFIGGTRFMVAFEEKVDADSFRDNLAVAFTDANGSIGNPTIQAIGAGGNEFKIETDFMINDNSANNQDELIRKALDDGLAGVGVKYEIGQVNKVDPTISDDFRRDATTATIMALLVIFLYIFFRFRKWQYGLGALVAMTHDVIIVLALFSIFYGILPFTLEVNQAFIAAILTVIGYSINDTVIVFDRIREYLAEHKKEDQKVVINRALNSTLGRTINTSLSTFVVLLTIFIFGGDDIKGFSFALMVGIAVGTYSSIFIATPSVIDLTRKEK